MVHPRMLQDRLKSGRVQVGEDQFAEVVQLAGGAGDRLKAVELQLSAGKLRQPSNPALERPEQRPAELRRQVHDALLGDRHAAGDRLEAHLAELTDGEPGVLDPVRILLLRGMRAVRRDQHHGR